MGQKSASGKFAGVDTDKRLVIIDRTNLELSATPYVALV